MLFLSLCKDLMQVCLVHCKTVRDVQDSLGTNSWWVTKDSLGISKCVV